MLNNFTPNKSYAYLLSVEPGIFLETYNTDFDDKAITFTDLKLVDY